MTPDALVMLAFLATVLMLGAFFAGRAYERWSWQFAIWRAERLGSTPPAPYKALGRYVAILVVLGIAAIFLPR